MKIEKSSYSEIYVVETEDYDIAIKYSEYLNLGYGEWELLSVQNKDGLEATLLKEEKKGLEKRVADSIIEYEKAIEKNNVSQEKI